ncbi:uncharacterized protein LOC135492676 isoform X2 [Lineus longissimus]|uniref:uncharacterized protein LOC135492676 isoform X2 n=1 Tax=Lineus longissimus TaxID=88925 RepID=UPI002B4FAB40
MSYDHNPPPTDMSLCIQSQLEPYRPSGPVHGPQYRPFSRSLTSYSTMNDWMGTQGREQPTNVPVTLTDGNWKYVRPATIGASLDEKEALRRLVPNDDAYFQRYMELVDKKAYRYPDPGMQKQREGCLGGSWRHVKQVLGQGGNNLVFVDGLTRLYDHSELNEQLTRRKVAHVANNSTPLGKVSTPLYSVNRNDISSYRQFRQHEQEKRDFKPWMVPKPSRMPAINEAKPPSRLQTQIHGVKTAADPNKAHRGFYQRN